MGLASPVVIGLLDGDHSAAVTTISLLDASDFPADGGIVLIDLERIKYTGKSSNDLTGCTRAFNSTTASTHGSRAEVILAYDPNVCARINRFTNQSISNVTWTPVSFSIENFDIGGMADIAGQPTRLTIPTGEGGKYLFTAIVHFAAAAGGQRKMELKLNGITVLSEGVRFTGDATSVSGLAIVDIQNVSAGDYVEIMLWHDQGAAVNILGGSTSIHLSAHRLS